MSRIDYQMSAADLRTFDRWHSRGAAILLAALLLMPWLLGVGPNSVRPAAAPTAASAGPAAPPRAADPPSAHASTPVAPAQATPDPAVVDLARR